MYIPVGIISYPNLSANAKLLFLAMQQRARSQPKTRLFLEVGIEELAFMVGRTNHKWEKQDKIWRCVGNKKAPAKVGDKKFIETTIQELERNELIIPYKISYPKIKYRIKIKSVHYDKNKPLMVFYGK